MPRIHAREVVFATRWFDVVAKHTDVDPEPFYALDLPDYVSVMAIDAADRVLLVRQFRPAVEASVLELPSGTVEDGEEALDAAKRELCEETGVTAGSWTLIGTLLPDSGRFENKLWCYLAEDLRPEPGWQ